MLTLSIGIMILSFLLVCFGIRTIITISHKKHLFDEPTEIRKIHSAKTPTLGGVAIYISWFFTSALFIPGKVVDDLNYLVAASVILVSVGIIDDLIGVTPVKKITVQFLAALLTTTMGNVRIESMCGIFGIHSLPYWISIFLSVLFILFMINAVNLVDGINGLAGSIGALACLFFSYFFWTLNEPLFFYLSVCLFSCLLGFLFYNITPARIFMGDTGSLFLGFILSIFAVKFLNASETSITTTGFNLTGPAFMFALLIIPIFDTLRVFLLRILNKKSPFAADRNHIHHLLLDLRLSHLQATTILISVNISFLLLAFLVGTQKTEFILLILIAYAFLLYGILRYLKSRRLPVARLEIKKHEYSTSPPQIGSVNFIVRPGPGIIKMDVNVYAEEVPN